jgi:hypothetical protein
VGVRTCRRAAARSHQQGRRASPRPAHAFAAGFEFNPHRVEAARTLLYEAANVMLTRYKGQLKLKDWAFAIARRSTMRKARVALARRLAIIMHAMLRDGTEFTSA